MLSPTNYFWYAYGFCTTLFVQSAMTSFVGTRADFVIVRAIIYSGVMMCYGFRGLAIGPVTVYGVMMWYGIWYVLMIWCVCDMMCLETVRRFENFWSYDVLWHQRRGVTTFLNPIHDLICICTFASRTGLLCLRCWCVCSFWLQLCLWFLYLLLYILSTSPVLTPVSSGAVFHARRYRSSFGWSSSLGYSFCCVGELPFDSEPSHWYISFVVSVSCIFGWVGTAGPCPVLCSYVLFCLEACSQICGSWVRCVCMWVCFAFLSGPYAAMAKSASEFVCVCMHLGAMYIPPPLWCVCVKFGDVYSASFLICDLSDLYGRLLRISVR